MIQRTAGAVAAVLVATLSGCGAAPASLHPMAQAMSLQIQAPVKWTSHRSFHDDELSLVPGTYVAGAGHGIGTNAVGSALGTGLVASFIAADLGTYHDVDTQPPAGWRQAAKAPN